MQSKLLFATTLTAALAPFVGAEEVLGVYIFHRHGDRTSKAWNPVDLTPLGASQVFAAGDFYRRRYIASDAGAVRVNSMSADRAVVSQLSVTSPVDSVLHNSAVVFLQGLYPPSASAGSQKLANGTTVESPLGGYQYIPVNAVSDAATSTKAESNAWLQGGSGCGNAVVSSNSYFQSADYLKTYDESKDLYQSLLPVINSTFNATKANFKNGYSIFDYINVAEIHNATIPSKNLLTQPTLDRLYDLASVHEWGLAYNASEPIRAIAGSVLAGQIFDALQDLVNGKSGAPTFNVQFGAYGTFMAFFGLAQLPAASPDFFGICNYASSMVFELVAPSAKNNKPEDASVRFYFSNGTADASTFKPFPLFGQKSVTLSWNDFKAGITKFAIADTAHWCQVCGNTEGTCAATVNSTSTDGGAPNASASSSNSGVSKPVAGVIGALVTLVVVLGVQAAVILFGGLRLIKKSTLAQAGVGAVDHGVKA